MCSRVDVVEEAVTSLRAKVQEWKSRKPMATPNLSAIDAVMAGPSTALGPIDDLFEGLHDNEDDGHDVGQVGDEEAGDGLVFDEVVALSGFSLMKLLPCRAYL
ncbi:hypothetical protein HAX54_006500 [Datura stramonium]|uniref:Uncharacterized protein n=1 Tax=Datura stramonium TaxID=4076 RepID=A0ABS8TD08_DATST|nr:hypothetical protein [Datura stramonium]